MAYSSTREKFLTGASPVSGYRRTTPGAREAFPDLEPAERTDAADRRSSHLRRILGEIGTQYAEIRENPAANNALARLAVYTLNAVLLVLAFPVGFAMLIFNVLVGENLRTTIHVLALTGLAMALANTEAGARVLGLN